MVADESSTVSDEYGTPAPLPPGVLAATWQATLFIGVLTLILGIAWLGFVRYRRLIDSFAVKLSVVCKAWI